MPPVRCRVNARTASYVLISAVTATSMGLYAQAPVRPVQPPRPAARPWTLSKTPWGEPDLQGVWNYGTMTPLERPAQWASKTVLTQEEAEAYQKQQIERRDGNDAVTAGPDW